MTTVRENLIAAKALIDTPEKWASDSLARKVEGGKCLCALDAVAGVVGSAWEECGEGEREALGAAVPAGYKPSEGNIEILLVAAFNDDPSTTHADIMALFDRAIAALESR